MSRSVDRVREALAAAGVDTEIRELDASTRTAPEAAAAVGCELGAIVKSLVFRGHDTGVAVLALVRGSERADEEAVSALAGDRIERASPQFVREETGFAIGGVPPLGHGLTPLVDEGLLAYDEVWAAAGTPRALFGIAPQRLVEVTGGRVVRITP